jgi:hypothetical protein
MRRAILPAIMASLVLLLATYAGDYMSLRYQIPHGRPQYGQTTVETLYAIHEKAGKTEYQLGQPETDTCVHSLFPHFGYLPCWYTNRHTEKRIEI